MRHHRRGCRCRSHGGRLRDNRRLGGSIEGAARRASLVTAAGLGGWAVRRDVRQVGPNGGDLRRQWPLLVARTPVPAWVHYNDETPARLPGATKLVRAGVDLDVGQALLGYASLACTTVYLHARDEDKRRAVESWPRVGGIGERLPAAHRWCIQGRVAACGRAGMAGAVSYTHLRAHETPEHL